MAQFSGHSLAGGEMKIPSYRDALLTPVEVRTADSRSVYADDFPALPRTLAGPVDFLSRFRSVTAGSRRTFVSDAGSRLTFVSDAGSRSTFVSDTDSRHTLVSDAGSRPTFVSDAGPRPTFVSDAGSRPTFVSDAGPRPTFVSGAGSRPTFVSDAGPRPTFVSGAGLVFNDSISVATDSFDTYLYIQTLFQMHLLLQSPNPAAVSSPHAASPPRINMSPHITPSAPSTSSPGSPQTPVRNSPIHSGRVWQKFQEHVLTFKEKTDVKFDRKL